MKKEIKENRIKEYTEYQDFFNSMYQKNKIQKKELKKLQKGKLTVWDAVFGIQI